MFNYEDPDTYSHVVDFNGVSVLLIAEDALVSPQVYKSADYAVRIRGGVAEVLKGRFENCNISCKELPQ